MIDTGGDSIVPANESRADGATVFLLHEHGHVLIQRQVVLFEPLDESVGPLAGPTESGTALADVRVLFGVLVPTGTVRLQRVGTRSLLGDELLAQSLEGCPLPSTCLAVDGAVLLHRRILRRILVTVGAVGPANHLALTRRTVLAVGLGRIGLRSRLLLFHAFSVPVIVLLCPYKIN